MNNELLDRLTKLERNVAAAQKRLDRLREQWGVDQEWQLELDRIQTELDKQKKVVRDSKRDLSTF
jgi:hypothetical protein